MRVAHFHMQKANCSSRRRHLCTKSQLHGTENASQRVGQRRNVHFLAEAGDPAAALSHSQQIVPGVEGAMEQHGAGLRVEQLEDAREGKEQCALHDRACRAVSGRVVTLHPVQVADNNADASGVELVNRPVIDEVGPIFRRRRLVAACGPGRNIEGGGGEQGGRAGLFVGGGKEARRWCVGLEEHA
jgi:hypothetical protein